MRRLILICLLWAGLHFYVVSRLLSIPSLAHHVPTWLLVPVVILLAASYIVSVLLEHYGPDSLSDLSHVLEIAGAYWVGAFFLLFSTFLVFDLCTGFGLWLRPQLPALPISTPSVPTPNLQCHRQFLPYIRPGEFYCPL